MKRWSGLLLVVLTACGNGPHTVDPPEKQGNVIVETFERLSALKNRDKDYRETFRASRLFHDAFDLRAARILKETEKEEFRIRTQDFKALLEDETGRLLLDEAARGYFFVMLQAPKEEVVYRAAALKRLQQILQEKGERPDLRSLPAETAESEIRELLIQVAYRMARGAFARRYDESTGSAALLAPALLSYSDVLSRLARFPKLRKEYREHFERDREALLEDPHSFPDLSFEAEPGILLATAVKYKDRAVVEKASGGSPSVVVQNFLLSVVHFVVLAETASDDARRRFEGELSDLPLILNEIEVVILKDD